MSNPEKDKLSRFTHRIIKILWFHPFARQRYECDRHEIRHRKCSFPTQSIVRSFTSLIDQVDASYNSAARDLNGARRTLLRIFSVHLLTCCALKTLECPCFRHAEYNKPTFPSVVEQLAIIIIIVLFIAFATNIVRRLWGRGSHFQNFHHY